VQSDGDSFFIKKPDKGSCGDGISIHSQHSVLTESEGKRYYVLVTSAVFIENESCVFHFLTQLLLYIFVLLLSFVEEHSLWIVQRYIKDTMTYRGCKFDLRVYVLVNGIHHHSLEAFVSKEMIARVCALPYRDPTEARLVTSCFI
jgi:hypothetical protein